MAYIDRDKLLEELQEEIDFESAMYTEEQNKWFERGLKCAYRDAKNQPTADVVEVRHGENIGTLHPVDEFVCSECGIVLEGWTRVVTDEDDGELYYYEYEFSYCPRCGAKIDGGKKE